MIHQVNQKFLQAMLVQDRLFFISNVMDEHLYNHAHICRNEVLESLINQAIEAIDKAYQYNANLITEIKKIDVDID